MSDRVAKKIPERGRAPRDKGAGSVYQRKSDGLWIGTFEAGWTAEGTRRRIQISAKTEAQAKIKLRNKRAEVERLGRTSVSARTTVKQWAETWLGVQERNLRPKSYATTASAVKKWIVPQLGHRRFADLTPEDVRRLAQAQRDAGLVTTSMRRTHSDLMAMLKAAKIEGHPVPERLLLLQPPEKSLSDREAMTVDEAIALLEVAADQPDGFRWVAALLNGIRQGERLGLTWAEIDFDAELITVAWQLQPLPYRVLRDPSSGFRVPDGYESVQVRGRWHLVRPKSKAGWRVLPLLPWLATALKRWQALAPTNEHGLVWPVAKGDANKIDDQAWYALQDQAGVKHPSGRHYTIHEARHTTATLLLEAGVDPAIIAAICGHAALASLRNYQHIKTEVMRQALEKLVKRVQKKPPTKAVRSKAVGRVGSQETAALPGAQG